MDFWTKQQRIIFLQQRKKHRQDEIEQTEVEEDDEDAEEKNLGVLELVLDTTAEAMEVMIYHLHFRFVLSAFFI